MKTPSRLRKSIGNVHSDHQAIARGMAWVSLFVFLGKLAGAGKEMVVAYRYGVNEAVDAYLLVFNLISWPVNIWFCVLCIVLAPLIARVRQHNPEDIPEFRAELLAFSALLGLNFALIMGLGLPFLLSSAWLGLSEATQKVAIDMIPSMLALAPLSVLISLFSAWLLSSGRHVNTLLEGVPAITILIAVLFLPDFGIEALVWGTVAGLFLHLVSLAVPLVWRGEMEAPKFTQRSPHWSAFWHGFGIMLVGQILMSFTTLIDQFFAAQLGTGAIATMSYANRIVALILGLGATAVGRATLPVFSRIQEDAEQLYNVALRWAGILFLLGFVGVLAGWFLAPWGVKLLFERGEFTAQNTEIVADVFRYGLMQVPFYFVWVVLSSLLGSQRKYRELAIVSGINLFAKVIANFALVPLFNVNGIVLGTAFMYMMAMLLCLAVIQRTQFIDTQTSNKTV